MDKLLSIMRQIKPNVDFLASKDIITDGLLSSMDIMTLISYLNKEYDIERGIGELRPENFKTIESIIQMINKLKENN